MEPLEPEQGKELVQSLLPVRDDAAVRLSEHAGGVPFLMVESLRRLTSNGQIYASAGQYWVKPDAWESLTPDLAQARPTEVSATEARAPSVMALQRLAALMGVEPDLGVLAEAHQCFVDDKSSDFEDAVKGLLQEGLFVETEQGGVRFRHGLLWRGCRREAEKSKAASKLNDAIARALESADAPRGRIGLHRWKAGRRDALPLLVEAGEQAVERGRLIRAEPLLEAARDILASASSEASKPTPQQQWRRRTGIATGKLALRRSKRSALEEAISLLATIDSDASQGWTHWLEGEWILERGHPQQAADKFVRAAECFGTEASRALLRTRESLANARRLAGEYDGAEKQAVDAIELARACSDLVAEGRLAQLLGFVYLETERYEEATDFAERSLAIWEDRQHPTQRARSLKILSGAQLRRDHPEKAAEQAHDALALFREVGDVRGETAMLNLLAMCRHEAGSFGQARQYALEALERSLETDERTLRGRILNNLAQANEKIGRHSEAQSRYMQALAWSRDIADRQNEARVALNLSRLIESDEPHRAYILARHARRVLEELDLPYLSEAESQVEGVSEALSQESLTQLRSDDEERLDEILEAARNAKNSSE